MKKPITIAVKINKGVPGYLAGVTTTVVVDKEGTPLEKFWRDRFLDAKTDNCVEIVKPESKAASKKEDPKS